MFNFKGLIVPMTSIESIVCLKFNVCFLHSIGIKTAIHNLIFVTLLSERLLQHYYFFISLNPANYAGTSGSVLLLNSIVFFSLKKSDLVAEGLRTC